MKKHPLSSLSFLKPLPALENTSFKEIIEEAEKSYKNETAIPMKKETKENRKILSPLKKRNESTLLIKEIKIPSDDPFFQENESDETAFKLIEENAEKFKSEFKEITNQFKDQIKELNVELQESKKRLDMLLNLKNQSPSSFFKNFFKKKNKALTIAENNEEINKEVILSPSKISNSKMLLSYASDWTRTIFSDRILFKAIPGSGTIFLILPKGNIRFIQFNYKNTPIHPIQEHFINHLMPHKVYEFKQFIDYRNWIYEEMRKI